MRIWKGQRAPGVYGSCIAKSVNSERPRRSIDIYLQDPGQNTSGGRLNPTAVTLSCSYIRCLWQAGKSAHHCGFLITYLSDQAPAKHYLHQHHLHWCVQKCRGNGLELCSCKERWELAQNRDCGTCVSPDTPRAKRWIETSSSNSKA